MGKMKMKTQGTVEKNRDRKGAVKVLEKNSADPPLRPKYQEHIEKYIQKLPRRKSNQIQNGSKSRGHD